MQVSTQPDAPPSRAPSRLKPARAQRATKGPRVALGGRRVATRGRKQFGATLLEALVAFLVLSLGMLSMARLQTQLRLHSDVARQRSEAVRLAQEELEQLRAFGSLAQGAGVASFADIAAGVRSVASLNQVALNTRYELTRRIDGSESPRIKSASVSVEWADRSGELQRVVLDSVIAGHNPALSSALSLRGAGEPVAGAFGRSAQVPRSALDLGDGRSAFKPVLGGDTAWVFNNHSGQVIARCSGVGAATLNAQLAAHLANCAPASGLLLSGLVRFAAPDGLQPLAITLAQDGNAAAAPECSAEAQKTVAYATAAGTRREAVPANAAPASVGVAAWADLGERFVAYHCLVAASGSPARWSGRSSVLPQGWTLGNGAQDRKVCRFSADQDGSGSVDRNAEHPEHYREVDAALAEQNFLVVRGDAPCPGGAAVNVGAAGAQVFSNLATVQHQP